MKWFHEHFQLILIDIVYSGRHAKITHLRFAILCKWFPLAVFGILSTNWVAFDVSLTIIGALCSNVLDFHDTIQINLENNKNK